MCPETVHVCSHGLISTRFLRVVLAHTPQYLWRIPVISSLITPLPPSEQSALAGLARFAPRFR